MAGRRPQEEPVPTDTWGSLAAVLLQRRKAGSTVSFPRCHPPWKADSPKWRGSCLSDLEPTRLPERPPHPTPPNTHTGHLKMLQCLPGRSLHTGWEPCLERSTLSSCGDPGGLGDQKPRGRHHQMQEREMSLKHVI